ncbi:MULTISPECIES: hypothetical protein [unclassified Nonomuraea]|nr:MULTISPECIES: hypothetical protein [unclassified Nonomuraea]
MQQVVLRAIDDYLERASEDEITEDLARKGAERFSDLLRRLGE